MRDFAGKTAFVTGGAAGIGFALGRAFAQAGMKVMLADIEADALQAAVKSLQEISPDIRGTLCDVTDAESVERAAQATFDAFGQVHVVCNNAGVAAGGGIDPISLDNWRWVIDVNLMGVLHGIKVSCRTSARTAKAVISSTPLRWRGWRADWDLVPTGRPNSPSSACRRALAFSSSHSASASASCARALSAPASARAGAIGPERYGQSRPLHPASPAAAMVAEIAKRIEAGIDPDAVAARVLTAIREDELYVFTHLACGPRSSRDSPPFWPRWTGFRPRVLIAQRPHGAIPRAETRLDMRPRIGVF